MKAMIGIISWLPDDENLREQRATRLDFTFKQLHNIFGEDVSYLVVAQNWKSYKVPEYIENIQIVEKPKLGILNARKALREEFLKTNFDYLIMADDDIVLSFAKGYGGKSFLKDLEKHPEGFMFIRYGWSLTFCAISRWIYEREPMVDVDPEKGEGYEDTTFPNLLHYKYPDKEFKIEKVDFLQHKAFYHKDHPSTWVQRGANKHSKLKFLTDYYVARFKVGKFEITSEVKKEALSAWENRPKSSLDSWIEVALGHNPNTDKDIITSESINEKQHDAQRNELRSWIKFYKNR